jgi:Leucine-rich repeat (LRR) protein
LDVSRNTALTELYCRNNQLTHLDVSKNTALKFLNCGYNQFSAAAINALFVTLHDNIIDHKLVDIAQNPGADACNMKIAENKGWDVLNHDIIE